MGPRLASTAEDSQHLGIRAGQQLRGNCGGSGGTQVGEVVGFHNGQRFSARRIKQQVSGVDSGLRAYSHHLHTGGIESRIMARHQQQDGSAEINLRPDRHAQGGMEIPGKGFVNSGNQLFNM